MIKAVFIDFYGTIVYEDGEVVKKISQKIYETGNAKDSSEVAKRFRRRLPLLGI